MKKLLLSSIILLSLQAYSQVYTTFLNETFEKDLTGWTIESVKQDTFSWKQVTSVKAMEARPIGNMSLDTSFGTGKFMYCDLTDVNTTNFKYLKSPIINIPADNYWLYLMVNFRVNTISGPGISMNGKIEASSDGVDWKVVYSTQGVWDGGWSSNEKLVVYLNEYIGKSLTLRFSCARRQMGMTSIEDAKMEIFAVDNLLVEGWKNEVIASVQNQNINEDDILIARLDILGREVPANTTGMQVEVYKSGKRRKVYVE